MNRIIAYFKREPIWAIFLGMFLLSSIFVRGFFSTGNFLNILVQLAVDGMLALGMTYLMINGYFDLSVGTVMGFAAALTIGMQPHGLFVAIVVALAAGALIGFINGFFVAKAKINAFIVTLGSFIGVRGLIYIYTKEDALIGEIMDFGMFGASSFLGFPTLFVITIVFLAIAGFGLRMTPHGRHTYAVGGNMEAAENAGIPVDRTVMINFTICGLTAAMGGVLLAARLNAATPGLGWPDKNLMIIATVVLGGTSLTGGSGSITRTIGGLFTIGMLYNILNLLNVQSYYNTLIMGIVLILVVYADSHIRKRKYASAAN
jgi:ribose transport system permease protein